MSESLQTPLDAALLLTALRELYRKVRCWADSSSLESDRVLCQCLLREIEHAVESQDDRRKMWEAAKKDLLRDLIRALDARSHEVDGSEDSLSPPTNLR